MTTNRQLSMVVVCIARNGACLNGLAKVVEDGNLSRKKNDNYSLKSKYNTT